jgi:hypothetical protein
LAEQAATIRTDAKGLAFHSPELTELAELHEGYLSIQLMYTPDELDAMAKRAMSEPTRTIEEVRRELRDRAHR